MSRVKRAARHGSGTWEVRIDGQTVNVHFARIVYRCAVCLSVLQVLDHGLKCKVDTTHRGFVHRDESTQKVDILSTQLLETEIRIYGR